MTRERQGLQEFWSGEMKENKGAKGKDGKPLNEVPNITREQVGTEMPALAQQANSAYIVTHNLKAKHLLGITG